MHHWQTKSSRAIQYKIVLVAVSKNVVCGFSLSAGVRFLLLFRQFLLSINETYGQLVQSTVLTNIIITMNNYYNNGPLFPQGIHMYVIDYKAQENLSSLSSRPLLFFFLF